MFNIAGLAQYHYTDRCIHANEGTTKTIAFLEVREKNALLTIIEQAVNQISLSIHNHVTIINETIEPEMKRIFDQTPREINQHL